MAEDDPTHIYDEIERLAEDLGHPPQATQLLTDTDITQYKLYKHHERYDEAVEEAGFDPADIPRDITDSDLSKDELHDRILDVAVVSTDDLKMTETLREANVSRSVVYEHYDSWGELLDDLGLKDRLTEEAQRELERTQRAE